MIRKTSAIVLRFYPYSNTSRVVSWLTPDEGRVATLVKGSQRPRSSFLGQYDLFYTCELVYYARERTGLHIARECAPLKTRDRLRTDWKAAAAASYLSDLASRVSPPNAPHPEVYDLLDAGLDVLAAGGVNTAFLFWMELRVAGALGLAPRLRRCLECGQELRPGARTSHFSYARGGILCGRCGPQAAEGAARIPADVLAMLIGWQRAKTPQGALGTHCTARQMSEIERLLGLFLEYHLDTRLPARAIALDVLKRRVA